MLARFCLYGFLKNQKYYEPFLVLVFLEKGLSFFQIGLLISFRELWIHLLEIPSGAAADLYGRRRAMLLAFAAYQLSFLVFAFATSFGAFLLAMLCFAVGESFRSGTHKAMIFDWLSAQGMGQEKARVYGKTRSWSQLGSAVSVLIAAAIVIFEGRFSRVFLYALVPYTLSMLNFLGYPAFLDGPAAGSGRRPSFRALGRHLLAALRDCLERPALRRLLAESMVQKGTWATHQGYLQPVLQQAALALPLAMTLPFLGTLEPRGRTALLTAGVYFCLYLLTAVASRSAHRGRDLAGGSEPFTRWIWGLTLASYLALVAGFLLPLDGLVILCFVGLALLQNLWRPVFLERIDHSSDAALGATLLSIDNQSRSLFVLVAAPLTGLAVDRWGLVSICLLGLAGSTAVLLGSCRLRGMHQGSAQNKLQA